MFKVNLDTICTSNKPRFQILNVIFAIQKNFRQTRHKNPSYTLICVEAHLKASN